MHPLDPSWNKYKAHDWGDDWWIFLFLGVVLDGNFGSGDKLSLCDVVFKYVL